MHSEGSYLITNKTASTTHRKTPTIARKAIGHPLKNTYCQGSFSNNYGWKL